MFSLLFPLFLSLVSAQTTCPPDRSLGPDILGCPAGSTSIGGICCKPVVSLPSAPTCPPDRIVGPDLIGCPKGSTSIGGVCCNQVVDGVCPNGPSVGPDTLGCPEGTYSLSGQCCSSVTCPSGKNEGPDLVGCPSGTYSYKGQCCSGSPPEACPAGTSVGPNIIGCPAGTTPKGDECCASSPAVPVATTTTSAPACQDKVSPRSGVSECPQLKYLCDDPNYTKVMAVQCPKTCGLCGSSSSSSTSSGSSSGTCVDLKNPRTGISDCPSLRSLCRDSNYSSVMKVQCPKTCGFCGAVGPVGTVGASAAPEPTMECKDTTNAVGDSECPRRKSLCRHPAYVDFMKRICPVTCGYC